MHEAITGPDWYVTMLAVVFMTGTGKRNGASEVADINQLNPRRI
jgi:hypothetical protein